MASEEQEVPIDPGLDLHAWESVWRQFEDLARDDPAGALPEMTDFLESVAEQRGFEVDDDVVGEGQAAEVRSALRWAREVSDLVDAGEEPPPGDVADALHAIREAYASITAHG
jgi:hypothetical protein